MESIGGPSLTSLSWVPILEKQDREEAVCAVEALAHQLSRVWKNWFPAKELPPGCLSVAASWGHHTKRKFTYADVSMLTGAAGIGLALLAAVSEIEPRWDSMLLLGSVDNRE